MSKPFDRPITIEQIDDVTERWTPLFKLHASVNKAKSNNEYLNAGAIQSKESLVFEVRYFKDLEQIRGKTQRFRILYQNVPYDIEDYDDFMFQHKTVKLLGVS